MPRSLQQQELTEKSHPSVCIVSSVSQNLSLLRNWENHFILAKTDSADIDDVS